MPEEHMRKLISNKHWSFSLLLIMNSVNKIRIRNKYSYFYITEDPPFDLDTASPADRLRLRPSQVNNYFFIDFT